MVKTTDKGSYTFNLALTPEGVRELQKLLENPRFAVLEQQRSQQVRFTQEQVNALQNVAARTIFPTSAEMRELSHQIGLSERQIKIWFYNFRSRKASKTSSFSDSESSGDSIKEQNIVDILASLIKADVK